MKQPQGLKARSARTLYAALKRALPHFPVPHFPLFYVFTSLSRSVSHSNDASANPHMAPLFQVRQFAKDLEAGVDLVASQRSQALGAEALDHKRPHDAAVEHGALQDLAVDFLLRCQVTHESSGEGIAGASRVFHFIDG